MNWLLSLFLFVSLSAQAQKYYPANFESMPKLLSFHQLMYLPDAKRAEYIKDVRLALADMERAMAKQAKSNKSAEFEMWREHVQDMIARFGEMALPSAQAADEVTCTPPYTYDAVIKGCSRVVGFGVQCRANEVLQRDDSGTPYCALVSSTTPVQVPVAPAQPAPPTQPVQRFRPVGAGQTPAPSASTPAPSSGTTVTPTSPPTSPRPTPPTTPATVGVGTSNPPSAAAVAPGTSAPARRAIPDQCKKREESVDYHKDAATHVAGMNPPDPNLRNCIMGGMFSSYRNGQIRAGNCKKVNEFPPGSAASGTEKLKCPANKGMCNPMLYCGPKKGEAHCLTVNQNFTKSCEAKATDACDPFKGDTMVAGAKENWEEFKHDIDNLCLGSKAGNRFNEYFCEECKAIEARMKKIQAKYAAYTASMPAASSIVGAPVQQPGGARIIPASAPGTAQ